MQTLLLFKRGGGKEDIKGIKNLGSYSHMAYSNATLF